MNRIQKAEKLVKLEKEIKSKKDLQGYHINLARGIREYNQLCLGSGMSSDIRLAALSSFVKHVPDEGNDMLIRLQDCIRFVRGQERETIIKILVGVTRSTAFNSHQRVSTAVNLYNNCFFNVCHLCFADLACDRSILVKYRVESARYLYGTEIEENMKIAQETLLEIISTEQYPSEYRYKVIAGFISQTGISTMLNFTKIKVPYDENFLYPLQKTFFFDKKNGIRERILSGQHLLQMESSDKDLRSAISKEFIALMCDTNLDENIRADVADVLLREGSPEDRKQAREIIIDLGYSPTDKPQTLGERERTIYSDSQNIHNEAISKGINKFIEKIINETDVKIRAYHEIQHEVCDLVRKSKLPPRDRHKAYKALNRISVDTATFTKYKISISEIFVHVWLRIQRYKSSEKENLEQRMIEELVDMADTCSSGHSGRLINVLSVYDDTLKISWKDQIKSNIVGRLMARIRDIKDDNLQAQISLGMLEDADPEDKKVYREFIKESLKDLHKELEGEFVGEGYIKKEEFEIAFKEGSKDL